MANSVDSLAVRHRSRTREELVRKIILSDQRKMGVSLILMGVVFALLAYAGTSFEDKDCTALLLTVPTGLYLLFTKRIVIRPW